MDDEIRLYLLSLGLDPEHVERGGMKLRDLEIIEDRLRRLQAPIRGIHVGNFLGFSLCYIAQVLKDISRNSLIFAIDPDIPCRGIERPADVVTKVLQKFDVEDMVIRITGFSLDKNLSNDGYNYTGTYAPEDHYDEELAPRLQLRNLRRLGELQWDFVLLDGNHNGAYLRNEIETCFEMIRCGGYYFIDDVFGSWPEVEETFWSYKDDSRFRISKEPGSRLGVMLKVVA